jgi:uncharacterized membrane protein
MSWIFNEEILAIITIIIIVGTIFGVALTLYENRVIEPFSELAILGPNMKIADYPREVIAGVPFKIYLYIGNHEGKSVYYRILVKIGDKSSFINEKIPLNSSSIIDIRRVLVHNSTWIYPLNITLYQTGINKRLVFEMWIYNETCNNFTYHGRWNQLWLNITKPQLEKIEYEKIPTISFEIEKLLINGFLAIRKAENNNGNINEMINLFNEYSNTEKLINQIISMEPEISKIGIENKNKKFIYNILIAFAIIIGSTGSYSYLRKEIWIIWSKSKSKWIIIPLKIKKMKKEKNQEKILNFISLNKNTTIEKILNKSSDIGYRKWEISKELFKMVKEDIIKLIDPNPPKFFFNYLFSIYGIRFWIVSFLLIITILSIYLSEIFYPLIYLRYILGSLFILFLPGYSLIETLYPKEKDLDPIERLALSIGLSLALVPLIGLMLNYTPWGIRLDPIVISLTFLTLILMMIASLRKYNCMKLLIEK